MQKIVSIDSLDALKMSIQCETDMQFYYEKAAELVKSDDAEAILKGLAERKRKHRTELVRWYSRISGKKILYLNLGKKHKLNTLKECDQDPNDAVRIAKANEVELKDFYHTISRRLLEANLREYFRKLVQEEEQHLALLESSFVEPLTLDQEPLEEGDRVYDELGSEEGQNIGVG